MRSMREVETLSASAMGAQQFGAGFLLSTSDFGKVA